MKKRCAESANAGHMVKIEVETETRSQVDEALAARADIIMLDNMDLETSARPSPG